MTECVVDDQPADGAQLCGGCLDQLAMRLREVPGLVDELETTVTRQDRLGARGGGARGSETPLPFNGAASDARTTLRDILGLWCRDVADRSGAALPTAKVAPQVTSAAAEWLLDHLRAVAHHPAAGDLYDEVTDAIWQAVRAIDRPPDTVFAGPCGCGALLYALLGRSTVTCRECAAVHNVADCWDWMRRAPSWLAYEGTSADVSMVLAWAGVQVSGGTIRKWAHRGKLARWGRRYRVGDVVAVAAA